MKLGTAVILSCLFESMAPKVGNVHRGADFDDLTFADFAVSAVAIGEAFEGAQEGLVGEIVLAATRAMTKAVKRNTYLGTILLLAPLAKLSRDFAEWPTELNDILSSLTSRDSELVYAAIREVQPGGMGTVDKFDLLGPAPDSLLDAMRAAQDRDTIAAQYTHGFRDLWQTVIPALECGRDQEGRIADGVVWAQIQVMAKIPDTLIARKCGSAAAHEASLWAAQLIRLRPQNPAGYLGGLADLDFWLRADENRRNPGTTADLLAAGLFTLLRTDTWQPPFI